jgi:hypothetical protein
MRKQAVKRAHIAHLKIMLHYWGKQRTYWGICPSSYIVKKCPDYIQFFKFLIPVSQAANKFYKYLNFKKNMSNSPKMKRF